MFKSRYVFHIFLSIIYLSCFVISINFNNQINNNIVEITHHTDENLPEKKYFDDIIYQNGKPLLSPDGKPLNVNEILKNLKKETNKNGHNFEHQFIGPDGKPVQPILLNNNDPNHQKNLNKLLNLINQQNSQKNKNENNQINNKKDPIISRVNNYIIDGEGNHVLVEAFNSPKNDSRNQNEQNIDNKDKQDLLFYYQPVTEDIKAVVNFNNSNKEHTISLYWTSQFTDSEDVFLGDILPSTSLTVSTFINHVFYATRKNSKFTRQFPYYHHIKENIESYSFKPIMIVENVAQIIESIEGQTIEGLEYM